ncbi:hypothetical protein [Candidatus Mesenet endosymbiont of Agriotes lineatus]|uniref:hypothetical protein n=1 Tax=Candidatus Mesenet endosymbiont of Agriotes lineatus TaxID=3077948 RepID=UPI0030CFCD25
MSHSRTSSISSIYSANTETSSNWDSEEGSNDGLNISNDFILGNPLPIGPSLLLTKDEEKLIDEFHQKMRDVEAQNDKERQEN